MDLIFFYVMSYKYYQDLSINGIRSNGYGEAIPHTYYFFEEMRPDLTVWISRLGTFKGIIQQIEDGDFNPEHRYRIRPFNQAILGPPWILTTRQRAWINSRISLIIVRPKNHNPPGR